MSHDASIDAICMAHPGTILGPEQPSVHGSGMRFDRSGRVKIPRPMNAFLLYRQRHHPILKQANPALHNNEICKLNALVN